MENISEKAIAVFKTCELAKSITGETPINGTECWIFVQDEKGKLNKNCQKCSYFNELYKKDEIISKEENGIVEILLKGSFNENRSPELKKVLDGFLNKGAKAIAINCSVLSNIHTTGLGVILRAFKSLQDKSGDLFIVNPSPTVKMVLESTKLIKIFKIAPTVESIIDLMSKKEADVKSGEVKEKEEEEKRLLNEAKTLRCWDFHNGQNSSCATSCSECHYKTTNTKRPCWQIIGEIDGATFEYIDENCVTCSYFLKFNPNSESQVEEL